LQQADLIVDACNLEDLSLVDGLPMSLQKLNKQFVVKSGSYHG
jgi:hypothetical protein